MRTHIVLFFLLVFSIATAQDKKSGPADKVVILRGADYAFAISVPQGWILDTSNHEFRKAAVLLAAPPSYARITIETATKSIDGKETLRKVLLWSAREIWPEQRQGSGYSIKNVDAPSLVTKDKKIAVSKRHTQTSTGVYIKGKQQPVTMDFISTDAYIDDRTVVTVIGLKNVSTEEYDKALSAFKKVVESYYSVP